jgi:putative polyketide hydroxylase
MVEHAGTCFAAHDLLAGRFTLLAGPEGQAWRDAATADRKIPLQFICIEGAAETTKRFQELYGVTARGAVLVRPDGFIAWRSVVEVDDPVAVLTDALARIGIAG